MTTRLLRRLARAMGSDPAFGVMVEGRRWLCPYCGEVGVRGRLDRDALIEAALAHLEERCPDWDGGEGEPLSITELEERRSRTEVRLKVQRSLAHNPTWKLVDAGRHWVCPFCVGVTRVEIPRRKVGDEAVDRISEHLVGCAAFDEGAGVERSLETIREALGRNVRLKKLAERVRRRLADDARWQRADAAGRWICPFCKEPQAPVDASSRLALRRSGAKPAAQHLLECATYQAARGERPPSSPSSIGGRSEPDEAPLPPGTSSIFGQPSAPSAQIDRDFVRPPAGMSESSGDTGHPLPPSDDDHPPPPRRGPSSRDGFLGAGESSTNDLPALPKQAHPPTRFDDSGEVAGDVGPAGDPSAEGDRTAGLPTSRMPRSLSETTSGIFGPSSDDGSAFPPPVAPPQPAEPPTLGPGFSGAESTGGMTIARLQESGEIVPIDDAGILELRDEEGADITATGAIWREEIKRELEKVKTRVRETSDIRARERSHFTNDLRADGTPLVPEVDGYSLHLVYKPPASQVPSTEFHDFLDLGKSAVGIVVGSVAGTGAESGLITAMARNLIRQHAREERSPAEILARVNADIFDDLDAKTFVSLFVGMVDPIARRLRFARAGLTPPCLFNAARDPAFSVLEPEGMVLGIDRGPIFQSCLEERDVPLGPGDVVVQMTNRLPEVRNLYGEEFGLERMYKVIQKYGNHEADYLRYKFDQVYEEFTKGTDRGDEVLMVILRADLDGGDG